MSIDAAAFREFEHAGWEHKSTEYHRVFQRLSGPIADSLLDLVGVGKGDRLLDVATGPGYLAAAAAQRGALVVGVDFAESMVTLARQLHPDLDFRQGDAEDLPFADQSFDVVISNLGLPHFPRPEQAVAEMTRVAAPGGQVALSTHAVPSQSAFNGLIAEAVQEAGAQPPADLPVGPPFYRYADDEVFAGMLASAGLMNGVVETVSIGYRTTAEELWADILAATVRAATLISSQSPSMQQRIWQIFQRKADAFAVEDGIEIPFVVKLAIGKKVE